MSKIDLDTKVKFIHGFSHKTRIQILDSIKDNEKTVSQIIDEIEGNQSSVSQHLACLRGCGLIVSRQEGKYVYYRIRNEQISQLLTMFDEVLIDVHSDMSSCSNNQEKKVTNNNSCCGAKKKEIALSCCSEKNTEKSTDSCSIPDSTKSHSHSTKTDDSPSSCCTSEELASNCHSHTSSKY